MNNSITEVKNTLEGNNSRINEAEDRISEVKDRLVYNTLIPPSYRTSAKLKEKKHNIFCKKYCLPHC